MSISLPNEVNTSLEHAIQQALGWSFREQTPDGFWVGQLESSSTMEAEWILAMHFLGIMGDSKVDGILKCIHSMQRPDGSWAVYSDAPSGDLNTTVECYAALRTSNVSPNEPNMVLAREWILSHGGVAGTRVFTKIWLAMIGEWPWDGTPCLPPELIFSPLCSRHHCCPHHRVISTTGSPAPAAGAPGRAFSGRP
jgi:squalene-hopene/tetraprenyl-beta-curcumene cyclase